MIQYDSQGITTQSLTEILDEREESLKSVMGDNFIIDKNTPIGNMELADATREADIQELIAWLIPNMLDANTATGVFLDYICEKNRIYRKQPQYTTLNLVITGTAGTEFESNDITVTDEISGIYYNLNEDCTIGSTGTVTAQFICQDYGEYYPLSTSTFEIQTPQVGLTSVTLDSSNMGLSIGRETETDEELRSRRSDSVGQTSTATLESIKSALIGLEGMNFVTYLENDTESTDANGLPMKSYEFIVNGGASEDIANTIFTYKAGGTRAYGSTIINKEDSEGVSHAIGFTRATEIPIAIDINIDVTSAQSDTWKNVVKEAIKEKFDNIQKIGANVKDYNYYTVLTQYPEISDITSIKFYDPRLVTPTKYSTYSIGIRQIATLETGNIHIVIGAS